LGFGQVAAQSQRHVYQLVDFALTGAVIDDGCPDRQAAVDHGRGGRDTSRLLQLDYNPSIHAIGVVCTVAKANDVQLDRGQQFQLRRAGDPLFQIAGQSAGPRNDRPNASVP
jgi:hypothetical protein